MYRPQSEQRKQESIARNIRSGGGELFTTKEALAERLSQTEGGTWWNEYGHIGGNGYTEYVTDGFKVRVIHHIDAGWYIVPSRSY